MHGEYSQLVTLTEGICYAEHLLLAHLWHGIQLACWTALHGSRQTEKNSIDSENSVRFVCCASTAELKRTSNTPLTGSAADAPAATSNRPTKTHTPILSQSSADYSLNLVCKPSANGAAPSVFEPGVDAVMQSPLMTPRLAIGHTDRKTSYNPEHAIRAQRSDKPGLKVPNWIATHRIYSEDDIYAHIKSRA